MTPKKKMIAWRKGNKPRKQPVPKKYWTCGNPGSDEAVDKGCTCAVMDNGHGNGYMGQSGIFSRDIECPLHN